MNYMIKLFFVFVLMIIVIYFVGFSQGNIYDERAIELVITQQEIINEYEMITKELLRILQQFIDKKEEQTIKNI